MYCQRKTNVTECKAFANILKRLEYKTMELFKLNSEYKLHSLWTKELTDFSQCKAYRWKIIK